MTLVVHEIVAPVSFGVTEPLLRTGAAEVLVADVLVPVPVELGVEVDVVLVAFEFPVPMLVDVAVVEAVPLTTIVPDMPTPPGPPWNWQ